MTRLPLRQRMARGVVKLAVAIGIVVLLVLAVAKCANAHDIWISRGTYKNPAGEWCCGADDCGVLSPGAVKAEKGGYSVVGTVTYGRGRHGQFE